MESLATITVTAGPDLGRSFALDDELVHIGRGDDNQVVLSDAALADHQASIVRRNGRYAIYSPSEGAVCVDGNEIPGERWVWLPRQAVIRLGIQTEVRLDAAENGASAESTPTPTSDRARAKSIPPPVRRGDSERARRKSRSGESRSQVARFLSDRAGEPLVKLGEDGQLPALELAELADERPHERREKADSNPLLLYGLLACSFVMSLGLLLIDPAASSQFDSSDRESARQTLQAFFGDDGTRLERHQTLLRQALVDHSQGNVRAEQDAYRQVLRLLNSSDIRDPRNLNGLTGKYTGRGRASDDELRAALTTLLAE